MSRKNSTVAFPTKLCPNPEASGISFKNAHSFSRLQNSNKIEKQKDVYEGKELAGTLLKEVTLQLIESVLLKAYAPTSETGCPGHASSHHGARDRADQALPK
jgi:hypothetical protein